MPFVIRSVSPAIKEPLYQFSEVSMGMIGRVFESTGACTSAHGPSWQSGLGTPQ